MSSPSEDIKTILDAESSLALTFGTNLFVSEMPSSPDECVGIYDTGGYDPEVNFIYQRPTIQVRIRGAKGDYQGAYDLAQSIQDVLNGMHNEVVGDIRIIGIWGMGDIIFVGYDDNHRPVLTVNFSIHRTKT